MDFFFVQYNLFLQLIDSQDKLFSISLNERRKSITWGPTTHTKWSMYARSKKLLLNNAKQSCSQILFDFKLCQKIFHSRSYLCSNISEKVFDVFPNEEVVHDCLAIQLQNLLELVDVIVLNDKKKNNS